MAGLIAERFARVASAHRNRVAIYDLSASATRTFAELEEDIESLTRALGRIGLPERPTIVVNVGNRPGFVALFVGALELSAAVILIDGDAPVAEALNTASAYGADVLIVAAGSSGADHLAPIPLPCSLSA